MWVFICIVCALFISRCGSASPCASAPDTRCWDATCATEIQGQCSVGPAACVDTDYSTMYSECNPATQTRDLIYFWKPPATCLNGTLPPPVRGIPCDLVCPEGTSLNLTTLVCQPCLAGSFSFGGGHKWSEWKYFPPQFSTDCAVSGSTTKTCQGWQLNGDNTDSGNNWNIDSVQSILRVRAHLVRPGYVGFEYKVNAERNYDGLSFTVNDRQVFFTSIATAWTAYNYTLNAGYHQIEWIYLKDRSISYGDDKLAVKTITIYGTTYAVTSCDKCPYGYFSNTSQASECYPCPADTYSKDDNGATFCKPCISGFYSFPGSAACIPSRPCSSSPESSDYSYYYTDCNVNHTKTYAWVEPQACDFTGNNTQLPPNVQESCSLPLCPVGQQRDPTNPSRCVYCSSGSTSPGGDQTCQSCLAGTIANRKVVYFDSWVYPWPTDAGYSFTSGCSESACFSPDGWRFGYWFTDSGTGHDYTANPWLQLAINAFNGATVQFNYTLSCSGDNQLLLTVDEELVNIYDCPRLGNGCSSEFNISSITLSDPAVVNRTFVIKWTYLKHTQVAVNGSCDRVMISSISVDGLAEGIGGGATQCLACPAGSYSNTSQQTQCSLCPLGSTSTNATGSSGCSECTGNTFGDIWGSPVCWPCGNGTTASQNKTSCSYDCSRVSFIDAQTNSTRVYNVSSLGSFSTSYILTSTGEDNVTQALTYNFYGNLCQWESACVGAAGPVNAHICQVNQTSQVVTSLGKTVTFSELYPPGSGLLFNVSYGDSRQGSDCVAFVQLLCDSSADSTFSSSPVVSDSDSTAFNSTYVQKCQLNLTWRTKYACALCTLSDYEYVDGACSSGEQTRSYYQMNLLCSGGVPRPPSEQMSCEENGTVNRGAIIAVAVVGSVLLVAALAGVAYLYYRNRQLYASYAQLKSHIPLDEKE